MRPASLNPLFAPAQSLTGIGPRLALLLKKCLVLPPGITEPRVLDLLWHLPAGVIDRRAEPSVKDAVPGAIVTLAVRVLKHKPPPRGNTKAPYKVSCEDDTGRIDLVFFRAERKFVEKQLPAGETRYISGRVERYGETLQMPHPDYIVAPEQRGDLPMLEPVYPLTAGLSGKILIKAARQAIERVPPLDEWQNADWLKARGWPDVHSALRRIHRPDDAQDVSNGAAPWQRLAYDELLAGQLALGLVRQSGKAQRGRSVEGDGRVRARIADALPFALTGSQRTALAEIADDLAAPHRMLRLLQGDVGSGKTIVALLALANVVECGAQGALMVPTEILARQHAMSLRPLCEAGGISVAVLTGREKGKQREDILERLASGDIDVLIGTHALFQEGVEFKDLGLVVIDEQHRFGVHQRLALQAKAGRVADLLVMTATPIPRTLALTVYGDMDVSKLTEKPAGRLPIDTRVLPLDRMDDVVAGLRRSMAQGQRAYWVCPLVEESELIDLAAAEERFKHLAQAFPGRVGLIHGKLKGTAKDAVMADFKSGALDVLVSTTVIEVGVDVPQASIMVIENAERFGLAQLHQLRGRVGRGSAKSSCLLLYQEPLGETAKARLKIMRETEDGFRIAEEDLRLRGAGEILGTQQAGLPLFRIADLNVHGDLLAAARDDAALILARDPELRAPRGEALRTLLYLFERDAAVKLLSAG